MNSSSPTITTDAVGTPWIRMQFKKNKVWVETDAQGNPLQKGGRVRIKYQMDQPHEYWVKRENVLGLGEELPQDTGQRPSPVGRPEPGEEEERTVHIFTDGASSGNPGPSGVGVVLRCGEKRKEISEYIGYATNNIAELMAIHKGLSAVKNRRLSVRLYTDSRYAYGVLSLGWQAKKNADLVQSIRRLMARFPKLSLVKVPGHQGVADNERADALATSAIRQGGKI